MKTRILLFIAAAIMLSACSQQASIKVQNLVHNASLTDISYGNYGIAYNLYPGATSSEEIIYDDLADWPKSEQFSFYMERDGNIVYLQTKYEFLLNAGDELLVVISDTTQVISPFGKKATIADLAE